MIKSSILVALAGLTAFSNAAPTSLSKRGGCKRGLAFGKMTGSRTNLFNNGPVCWGYNWEAQVFDYSSQIEFVPMLHSGDPMFTNVFVSDAELAIGKGAGHALSINEPDQCGEGTGGACMTVEQTISTHQEFMQKGIAEKHPKVLIGSPAVTNGQGTMGINFLKTFLDGCKGCRIDFLAAHWQNAPDLQEFKDHFNAVHDLAPEKNVWITEWKPTSGDVQKFMKDAMNWMDGVEWIERYAYMSVDEALVNGDSLSPLGNVYASA